jgi:hypothetical protein
MKQSNYCPVCGYDALTAPAADYNICPCCGTEFGYHDLGHTWAELRENWLWKGMPWFSHHTPPPNGWNPQEQLKKFALGESIRTSVRTGESNSTTRLVDHIAP